VSMRTDFAGHATTYTYDAVNQALCRTPDPGLGQPPICFTYTATGQIASMTDASGTTTYAYDVPDRWAEKTSPQGPLDSPYDRAGNLLSIRSSNPNGASVDYTYDVLNRLATVTDNRTGATTYTYDSVGNLARYVYPNGVESTFSYDNLNRLV